MPEIHTMSARERSPLDYATGQFGKNHLAFGARAIVAAFIETFKDYPPRQRPQSLTVDQIVEKLNTPTND